MTALPPEDFARPFVVASEHGPLHGEFASRSASSGIVVIARASWAHDARDEILAAILRHARLSTISCELLTREEEHFPDVHHKVSLLAKRLLDFLAAIRHRVQTGEIPAQRLGLYAAQAASPVAVRVAALRDHDVAAVVCRGGLIDLAGMLYLRALASPLLMLVDEEDAQIIASSRRALKELGCPHELKLVPPIGIDFANSAGFEIAARETAAWFAFHLGGRAG
jgi:hypothetical protein